MKEFDITPQTELKETDFENGFIEFTGFWRKLFHFNFFKRSLMKKVYIKSIASISAQKTFDNNAIFG